MNSHRQTIRSQSLKNGAARAPQPRGGLICLHELDPRSEHAVRTGRDMDGLYRQVTGVCRHCRLTVRLIQRPE